MKALTKAPKILLTAALLASVLGACKKNDTAGTAGDTSATAPSSTSGTAGTTGDTGTGTTTPPTSGQ